MKRYIKSNVNETTYRGYEIGVNNKTNEWYVEIHDKSIKHEDLDGLKSLLDVFIDKYGENYKRIDEFKKDYGC